MNGLRLAPSTALKEKRLAALLAGREPAPRLREAVEDAQALGSLELAGFSLTWEDMKAARRGEPTAPAIRGMHEARAAVDAGAPLSVAGFRRWQDAVLGGSGGGFRTGGRSRVDAPPPAPPEFIAGRLAILEQWLGSDSGRALKPVEQGALVLARLIEILPFEDGNGRVSRLAASHVMVGAGLRPPILVGADRPRLTACLKAAFRFDTEPLIALLHEASDRALDVMIQTLESP